MSLFVEIFPVIGILVIGAIGFWGVYQFTRPLEEKETKCKNLN